MQFETMQPGEHMSPVQFQDQAEDGTGAFGSPGLADIQESFNTRMPRGPAPSTSGNGMSPGQYEQTLGNQFPVDNGMAAGQYQTAKYSLSKDVL